MPAMTICAMANWCWRIRPDYKLTPDLAVGLAGNIAQFNYKNNHVRTGEISAFTRWTPSAPPLKNLTVWLMFGPAGRIKPAVNAGAH